MTAKLLLVKSENGLETRQDYDGLSVDNPTFTGGLTGPYITLTTDQNNFPTVAASLFWNATEQTYNIVRADGSTLSIGQENTFPMKNGAGANLLDGQLVRISGATGANPTVSLASASTHASASAIGMVTQPIANNATGNVATSISIVHTLDTSAYAAGTELFLSLTPGAWSATPPAKPNHRVSIGFVIRQHAVNGAILLWINVHESLGELNDVDTTSAVTGNSLAIGADGVWRPASILSGSGITGQPAVWASPSSLASQDATAFRGTISVPPVLSFTGSVDAKALNGGKAGLYRLAASTYTNFWTGITAGQQASVLQLESPTGLRALIASDNKAGGLLTRFQASDFPGDDWSDWYTLWDSGSLPVGVTGRAVLATTTQAGARTAIGAAPLDGVTNGSNAASGVVGQYYEAFLPEASFVYAVNGSPVAVLSLSLPAGDWLVEGRATAHITGAMNGNKVVSGLNTSIAIPTDGTEVYGGLQVFSATNGFQTMTGSKRFSLTATTTVYLVARIDFSAGTPALFGCMSARRMR